MIREAIEKRAGEKGHSLTMACDKLRITRKTLYNLDNDTDIYLSTAYRVLDYLGLGINSFDDIFLRSKYINITHKKRSKQTLEATNG